MQWNADKQRMSENATSSDMPRYPNSYFFTSTSLKLRLINSYLLEAEIWFLKIKKHVFCSGTSFLSGQKWKSCFQGKHILTFQLIVHGNFSFEFFVSKSQLTDLNFWMIGHS